MSTNDETAERQRLQAETDQTAQEVLGKIDVTIDRLDKVGSLDNKPSCTANETSKFVQKSNQHRAKQVAARSISVLFIACVSICILVLANTVNICAVVFAFQEYERDACPAHDICSSHCNPDAFMDVSVFLQIVGFSMMALSLLSVCGALFICPRGDDQPRNSSLLQWLFRGVVFLYYSAWVIVGCVLYRKLRDECKSTPKGEMFLAWMIIYAVYSTCFSWR